MENNPQTPPSNNPSNNQPPPPPPPPNYQQPPPTYQQPPQQPYQHPGRPTSVMTVGDWMITMLLMIIPIVNIVLLFVWAFDQGTNANKSNWAKASLIWFAIALVFYLFLIVIIGTAFIGSHGY